MQKQNLRVRVRKFFALGSLVLMAAACGPLGSTPSGAGVAKTSNASGDWQFANKAEIAASNKKKNAKPQDSVLASSNVLALKFVPGESKKLYAATQTQGIFYTENGADTWTHVLPNFNAYDVAVDPGNADHVFVAGQASGQARVVATVNHGKSWDVVYNDAATSNAARAIAFDPADSKTMVVGLNSGNLISTKDGGVTWTLVQNFESPISQLVWHKNRTLYILTRTKGLYVSQDAGHIVANITKQLFEIDTWRQRVSQYEAPDRTSVSQLEVPTQQTSAFYKVAIGTNPQLLYVAANNGLFSSGDGGSNWVYLKLPLRGNAQATDVRGLALADNDTLLYASVAGTVYKSLNAGQSWQVTAIATTATINYILVDPQFPQVAYAGFIGTSQ
jgi:photosystem II stability/assembly factor-like uncharacterized protein